MKRHDIKKKRLEKAYFRTVSEALHFKVFDPRLQNIGLVIERVEVDDEILTLTIFFSLQKKDEKNKAIKALYSVAPYLNKLMQKQVKIRALPHLKFFYDYKTEQVNNVLNLIDNLSAKKPADDREENLLPTAVQESFPKHPK